MRIAFTDPQGPRLSRHAMTLLALVSMIVAVTVWSLGGRGGWPFWISMFLLNLAGVFSLRQTRARFADAIVAPGRVQIRNAWSRNQTIWAKDVVGATTARGPRGVILTLAHADRLDPMTLEVASDDDAERLRRALGVGHGGFGMVTWRTMPDGSRTLGVAGSAFAAAVIAACALAVLFDIAWMVVLVGVMGAFFAGVGMLIGLVTARRPALPSIVMTAEALSLRTARGWFRLPYGALVDARVEPRHYAFQTTLADKPVIVPRTSAAFGGVSDHQERILLAQLESATSRARGNGPVKEDASQRLAALARRGESARAWLDRLEVHASALGGPRGYRGHTLEVGDLWSVLEDPEADAELRMAAARVLRQSGDADARSRIDHAIVATREPLASRRLRVALLDDVNQASEELSHLDAESGPARTAWKR